MIQNIQFKDGNGRKSDFQTRLDMDMKKVTSNSKLAVEADKSNNLYFISKERYSHLLTNCITSEYKRALDSDYHDIIQSEKCVADRLELADRMERPTQSNARITIKDHKPNFRTDTKCRLINPSKVDSGKVSKQILDRINKGARASLGYSQWTKTLDVTKWFTDHSRSLEND